MALLPTLSFACGARVLDCVGSVVHRCAPNLQDRWRHDIGALGRIDISDAAQDPNSGILAKHAFDD
jgi:hypothetical protein